MTNAPADVAPEIVSVVAAVTGAEMLTVPEVRAVALMPPVPRVRPPPGFATIASPAGAGAEEIPWTGSAEL